MTMVVVDYHRSPLYSLGYFFSSLINFTPSISTKSTSPLFIS